MSEADDFKVFISYRRDDTKPTSRLIYERLSRHFGDARVFFDIDNTPAGVDFVEHLDSQVAECSVLLAVMGPRWTQGERIFSDRDFVRIEIAAALKLNIPVIPIFADGAEPPAPEAVPASITAVLRRQGLPVDTGRDFNNHIQAVIRHTERVGRDFVKLRAASAEAERLRLQAQHRAQTTLRSREAPAAPSTAYSILERSGDDGMTEHFIAQTRGLEGFRKRVIVRRLLPNLAAQKQFVGMFLDEARLAGHLSHANVHSIIDVGQSAGAYFCVYDYLDYEPLSHIADEQRVRGVPTSVACASYICREVCRALQYAHGASTPAEALGVVHRDVSPANIYLVRDGRVVLSGFGLAKAATQLEQSEPGIIKGKFGYLSPELAKGDAPTFATDLFALGIVLWELLAGRRLFREESDLETVRKIQHFREFPAITALRSDYAGELDHVLASLLAPEPAQRFKSAAEARVALEGVLRRLGSFVSSDDISGLVDGYRERHPKQPNMAERMVGDLILDALHDFSAQAEDRETRSVASAEPFVDPKDWGLDALFETGAEAAPAKVVASAPAPAAAEPLRPATTGAFALTASPVTDTPPAPPVWRRPLVAASGAVSVGLALALSFQLRSCDEKTEAAATKHGSAAAPSAAASAAPPVAPSCPADMVKIPAGRFFQGSDAKDALGTQKPAHNVSLSAFCFDLYEVTAGQYRTCSDDGKCKRLDGQIDWRNITPSDKKIYAELCTTEDPSKSDHPVNCVTWDQARRYCNENDKRLPTESEWEYAARGPDGRVYPWGNEAPTAAHLNACGSECLSWAKAHKVSAQFPGALYAADDGWPTTAPVGKFPLGRSRFGPYDVAGNVWEWVADWEGVYQGVDQSNPRGPETGSKRVIRGGAWNGSFPEWLHPQFRYAADPDMASHALGFRCARDLDVRVTPK